MIQGVNHIQSFKMITC